MFCQRTRSLNTYTSTAILWVEVERIGDDGNEQTHLFDNKLEHHLRGGSQVVELQVLGLVETVLWCESAEEAVWAAVECHGSVGVGL